MMAQNAEEIVGAKRYGELSRELESKPEYRALTVEEQDEFGEPYAEKTESEIKQLCQALKYKGAEMVKYLISATGHPVKAGRDIQDGSVFQAYHEIWRLVSEYGSNGLRNGYSETMGDKFGIEAGPIIWGTISPVCILIGG